jgi:hypothetical protein
MATLANIRTRVLAKLVDAGGSIAEPTAQQVDAEINSVIDFYEPNKFWFNDATYVGNLVAGDATVPLPSDFNEFIEPSGLTLQISNARYPMTKISPLQYDSMFVGGSGISWYYTYRNQQVQLYFSPDQAYQYMLYYTRSYADLTYDNDSNDFTNYADRLIEYRTLAECYLNYRSDPEMAAVYERKAKEEFTRLVRQSASRLATGVLQTENITGYRRTRMSY